MNRFRLMAFASAALAAPALAADPPVFVVVSTDSARPRGELVRIAADGTVELAGARPIAGLEVVSIRRPDRAMPHRPHDRPHILFANGDRIPGLPIDMAGERLRIKADLGVTCELTVPVSSIAAIFWSPDAAARAATIEGHRELERPRKQDLVHLTNGDSLSGTLSGLEPDGPLILARSPSPTRLERDRIGELLFNTDLMRKPKPRGPWWRLVLANGARLSLRSVTVEDGKLRGTMLFGAELRVPVSEVVALDCHGGRAVFVSELSPVRYQFKPYLGMNWPLMTDRAVSGGELRLGGGTYDEGLGLHSACAATYAVPPNARRFEAIAGLDEVTGRLGAVSLQFRIDGKEVQMPALELRGGDRPRDISVPLPAGSREITIEVGYGPGGDVQDHLDLADARFIIGHK